MKALARAASLLLLGLAAGIASAQAPKKLNLLSLVGAKHDHAYFDAALTRFAENAEGDSEYMFVYSNTEALGKAIGSKVEMVSVFMKKGKSKLTEASPATSMTIGFASGIKDWKTAFANVGIDGKGMVSVAKAPNTVIYRSKADQRAKRKLANFNSSTHELEIILLP